MELKAGIIGCGMIGETHAECLSKLDGMKATAFCDIDINRAKDLLNKSGGEYYTDNVDKIIQDDSLSAIYICTYHDTHTVLAKKCCEAGKNVFMEKPMAINIHENLEIGEAVEKSRIHFMVGLKYRFYPAIEKAKEYISNPIILIGQLMDLRWDDSFWANDPILGGGNVLSQGCHIMDLIYFFSNSEPESIFAHGGNLNKHKAHIIDNITSTIKFNNNLLASVVIGDAGDARLLSKFSAQIYDGKKSSHLHNRFKTGIFVNGNESFIHDDTEELGFLEENRHFIHCLKNNCTPSVTWKDGYRASLMILKAFDSIKTGLPQNIIL